MSLTTAVEFLLLTGTLLPKPLSAIHFDGSLNFLDLFLPNTRIASASRGRAFLWLLYLSFVNIGQTFYSFGWEILLCEVGFLTIFAGSSRTQPNVWIRWMWRLRTTQLYHRILFRHWFTVPGTA